MLHSFVEIRENLSKQFTKYSYSSNRKWQTTIEAVLRLNLDSPDFHYFLYIQKDRINNYILLNKRTYD